MYLNRRVFVMVSCFKCPNTSDKYGSLRLTKKRSLAMHRQFNVISHMTSDHITRRLTLSTEGIFFSRRHIEYFLIFPKTQVLIFRANWLQRR